MVFKSGIVPDIYQFIKKKTFKGEVLKFPRGRKMSQLGVKLLSWVKIPEPMARNYFLIAYLNFWIIQRTIKSGLVPYLLQFIKKL